jgi:hypothetical protein
MAKYNIWLKGHRGPDQTPSRVIEAQDASIDGTAGVVRLTKRKETPAGAYIDEIVALYPISNVVMIEQDGARVSDG